MLEFGELRARRGRFLIVGYIMQLLVLLPLLVVLSSFFLPGLLFGAFSLTIGYVLILSEVLPDGFDSMTESPIWPELVIAFGVVVIALLAVAMVRADRIIPKALGARPADKNNPHHRRILSSLETVALAAGSDPILYVLDDVDWINVASLGRRGGRPVVLTTTAASTLDRRALDALAALGLAESLLGSGAARLRQASRVGWAAMKLARRWWPLLAGWYLVQLMAVVVIFGREDDLATTVAESGGLLLFQVASGVVAVITLAVVSTVIRSLTGSGSAASKVTIDLGALALLRDPHQWWVAMVELVDQGRQPSSSVRRAADWAVPVGPVMLGYRRRQVEDDLPAVGKSLAGHPYPEGDGERGAAVLEWIGAQGPAEGENRHRDRLSEIERAARQQRPARP